MADENPFAHLIPQDSATPAPADSDNPFAHLVPGDTPGTAVGTPATDQAIGTASSTLGWGAPRTQDEYQRMHGRGLTATESNARWQKFMEESGKPVSGPLPRYSEEAYRRNSPLAQYWPKPPWAIQTIGGLYNAGAGLSDFVTSPRGLAELGITAATGGAAGLPLIGAEMWPHIPGQIKQTYKAATGQLPPAESAEAAGGLALLAAPGAHVLRSKFGPTEFKPSLPAPPGTVYEALPFDTREIPPPPSPRSYTTTDPRLATAGAEEGVGPIIEQKTGAAPPVQKPVKATPEQMDLVRRDLEVAQNDVAVLEKMNIPVPEYKLKQVQDLQERLARGEAEPPLPATPESSKAEVEKRVGEMYAAKTEAEQKAIVEEETGGAAKPEPVTPLTDAQYKHLVRKAKAGYDLTKEEHDQVVAYENPPAAEPAPAPGAEVPLKREDMTAAQLSADIARQRSDPAAPPVSILDTQMLRQKQEAEAGTEAATEDPQITQLKARTADLRNQAADVLRRTRKVPMGESRQARSERRALAQEHDDVLTKLWNTWDQIHKIRTDSGKPREFVIIGGGAGGLKAAGQAAYEGIDTVVLEKETSTGGQAKRSGEIVNTGATGEGATGRDYFRPRYLTAKNRGAEVRTRVEVVNLRERADGGVDVITKHHGVIPAQRVAILTGSSFIEFPGMENSGWGNAERLQTLARGKVGMTNGGGNSATQAIVSAIREGAKKIVAISRSKFGHETSADQMERLYDFEKKGQVEFVQGTVKKITPDPSTGGVIVRVAKTKTIGKETKPTGEVVDIPVAHLENFLSTELNTGWIPEGVEKVPTFDRTGKPIPGLVKVRDASLKTTMPGVFAGGDIRDVLPGEEKARRIDLAEGDATEIATLVTKEILQARKSGKLPGWEATSKEILGLDEELKMLRQTEEEPSTPLTPSTGGPTIPSPTKNVPISSATSSTSSLKTTPKAVSEKVERPKKVLPPPPSPGSPVGGDQQQRMGGQFPVFAPGRHRAYVIPGKGVAPPSTSPVVAVANRNSNTGEVYVGKPGESHGQLMERTQKITKPEEATRKGGEVTRGWVDAEGNFLDSQQAWQRARVSRQLSPNAYEFKPGDRPPQLDSIDVQTGRAILASPKRQLDATTDPAVVEAEAATRVAQNPNYADKLVGDLNTGRQQSLDLADEVVLTEKRGRIGLARDVAGQRAMNRDLPKEERAAAASNYEDMDARVREMDRATDGGNILKGRTPRANWHQFRARDYSLPSMEQKLSIARGGRPVTAAESADLKNKSDTLMTRMAAVEKEKARTGWRPGMGKGGDIGKVRHKQFKAQDAKNALDNTIFKEVLKNKSRIAKGAYYYRNIAGVSRAIMTADWTSALLRQGGLLFFGGPIRSLRIMGDVARATKSDENYFRLMQDIRERPNAELYVRSKLGLTEIKSPKMQDLEEQYMGQWTEKIPILNHSQRAYVYFLNRLRADTFDTMAHHLGRNGNITLEQANGISNFINVFTGRGRIKEQYAGAIAGMNELFFAPRYVLSRFQAMSLQPLRYAKDPQVRKLIAAEYAKTLIGYGIFYGLTSTALQQFGVTIEKNPLSSDFGKIKMGDTRWDPLSGIAQVTTFTARALTAHTKTGQGKIEPLYGSRAFTARKYGDVLWKFLWSKFAPLPGGIVNAMGREKVTGEKTTPLAEAVGLVTPLNGWDVYNAMLKQGVTKGVAFALLANLGHSINTYSSHVKIRQRKPHRSRSR